MAQVGSVSGNQNGEVRKEEWQQATFKLAEWDSVQMGKRAKKENCQTVRSRRAYLSTSRSR